MKSVIELASGDLTGKSIIVRVDYNVPVHQNTVLDDSRIRASFETIDALHKSGATIILISHIEGKENISLNPVYQHLIKLHDAGAISWLPHFHPDLNVALHSPKDSFFSNNSVHLFENLRTMSGEKENSDSFAGLFVELADFYVNDAFPVCHRAHASVVALPKLMPGRVYAGVQLLREVDAMQRGLHPDHPFVFILGGAKFETKLPLIDKFLQKADKVVIGGALLNDILKAKGFNVGRSTVASFDIDISHVINHPALMIPRNVIVQDVNNLTVEKNIESIDSSDNIVDVGESLVSDLENYINSHQERGESPFVLWNGPMGLYEHGYTSATEGIARILVSKNVPGLVGGGDTVAAIAEISKRTNMAQHQSLYISTGGGAMIEYLMNDTLPGLEALA